MFAAGLRSHTRHVSRQARGLREHAAAQRRGARRVGHLQCVSSQSAENAKLMTHATRPNVCRSGSHITSRALDSSLSPMPTNIQAAAAASAAATATAYITSLRVSSASECDRSRRSALVDAIPLSALSPLDMNFTAKRKEEMKTKKRD